MRKMVAGQHTLLSDLWESEMLRQCFFYITCDSLFGVVIFHFNKLSAAKGYSVIFIDNNITPNHMVSNEWFIHVMMSWEIV